jgi:hypothetical protein
MKTTLMKWIAVLVLSFISSFANAQWDNWNILTFESTDTFYKHLIVIDTVSHPGNKWQVGAPHKATFTSGYMSPSAIVTDTLNPYPVNDTSVFILKIPTIRVPCHTTGAELQDVIFYYRLDIDSHLTASLEISTDSGMNWVNTKDSLPPGLHWDDTAISLSVSTPGWATFALLASSPLYSIDTFFLRFSIISDSVFSNKDGWIIDNIEIAYICEGAVGEVLNPNLITIYPNPSHGKIYLNTDKMRGEDATITIYDMQGKEVYKTNEKSANDYLNLQLPAGAYTLRYAAGQEYCIKRLIITR